MNFTIRPIRRPADDGFVFSSFLHSHRGGAPHLRNSEYFPQFTVECAGFIEGALIATSVADSDEILGWVAVHALAPETSLPGPGVGSTRARVIVDYCYVKKFARRLGVMTALLDASGIRPGGVALEAKYPMRPALVAGMRAKGYVLK